MDKFWPVNYAPRLTCCSRRDFHIRSVQLSVPTQIVDMLRACFRGVRGCELGHQPGGFWFLTGGDTLRNSCVHRGGHAWGERRGFQLHPVAHHAQAGRGVLQGHVQSVVQSRHGVHSLWHPTHASRSPTTTLRARRKLPRIVLVH